MWERRVILLMIVHYSLHLFSVAQFILCCCLAIYDVHHSLTHSLPSLFFFSPSSSLGARFSPHCETYPPGTIGCSTLASEFEPEENTDVVSGEDVINVRAVTGNAELLWDPRDVVVAVGQSISWFYSPSTHNVAETANATSLSFLPGGFRSGAIGRVENYPPFFLTFLEKVILFNNFNTKGHGDDDNNDKNNGNNNNNNNKSDLTVRQ